MGVLTRLRRYLRVLVPPWGTDDSADEPNGNGERDRSSDSQAVWTIQGPEAYELDPDAIGCRADIMKETENPPHQFVTNLLAAEGGRLPQQALTRYTDLSAASVSRLLQELEDAGVVVRCEVGRQKVVCLPESAPPQARPEAAVAPDETNEERQQP